MLNEVFGVLLVVCATALKAGVGASAGLRGIKMKVSRNPVINGQGKHFQKKKKKGFIYCLEPQTSAL